jgi:uroporphyrinogen decarboxylase
MAQKLSEAIQVPYEEPIDSLLSTRISHTGLLTALGNDCVGIAAAAPDDSPTVTNEDGLIVNEWGMRFKDAGLYNEFIEFPLAEAEVVEDVTNYNFPESMAAGRFDFAKQQVQKYGDNYAIVADLETSIFETSWYLVGLEKFLMDLMIGQPYVNALMDKIMTINTEIGQELIRMGADVLWCGDDFGTQHGMIMDPDTWRTHFKPRIRMMFEAFRSVNPDIKIAWHSCGSIVPIIKDFIEIGLDILNPIQPQANGMDPEYLKREYGKDLIFFGGVDIQDLLPNSTPKVIKSEIRRLIDILGKEGGYIVAPAHNIQPDTPVDNVLAFFEAVKEY